MEKLRREADGVLVVSAGDDLFGPQVPLSQKGLRARAILDGYERLGLDAMAIGEQDRFPGIDLKKVPARALVERAGIKVGVFSVDLETDKKPEAALRREADQLRKKGARLVVALLHGGLDKARQLLRVESAAIGAAAATPPIPIDIAVVSHGGWGINQPERAGATWLVEGPGQAKHFGQLDLHILDGKLEFRDIGQRGQTEALLIGQEAELKDVATRQKNAHAELKDFYDRRKKEIEASITGLRARLAAMPADSAGSWLENKLVPLGTEVADEPFMSGLVKRYKEEVAKLPPEPKPVPIGPSGSFTGAEACGRCHPRELAVWKKTKHAHAWASLVKKHQEKDAACIRCHVTDGPELPNVQCEACHGAGISHSNQPSINGLITRVVPEAACRTCHTPEQTGEWEFASFRRAVLGPGHGRP